MSRLVPISTGMAANVPWVQITALLIAVAIILLLVLFILFIGGRVLVQWNNFKVTFDRKGQDASKESIVKQISSIKTDVEDISSKVQAIHKTVADGLRDVNQRIDVTQSQLTALGKPEKRRPS